MAERGARNDEPRDERAALDALVGAVPYIGFLGVVFEPQGGELTARLPFQGSLIGNPDIPALHGGAIAAFLEVTALVGLGYGLICARGAAGQGAPEGARGPAELPAELPTTIDFTIDYLRAGQAREARAQAMISRAGRRFASVRVEAWQEHRARPFAQAMGHFLLPGAHG